MPALAVKLVSPAGRVVLIGVSSAPSLIDTRALVLADVTAIGILSASPGLAGTIELFASGAVNPEPLVSEVIGLEQVTSRLEGRHGETAPRLVDPRVNVHGWTPGNKSGATLGVLNRSEARPGTPGRATKRSPAWGSAASWAALRSCAGRRDVKVLQGGPPKATLDTCEVGTRTVANRRPSAGSILSTRAAAPTCDPEVPFRIDCHPIGTAVGDLGNDAPVGKLAGSLVKAERVDAMCRSVYVVKGCAIGVPRQAVGNSNAVEEDRDPAVPASICRASRVVARRDGPWSRPGSGRPGPLSRR